MTRGGVLIAACTVLVGVGAIHAEAGGPATIGASGDAVELRRDVEGGTVVDRLPLYRAGEVRYFSAGVGLEERQAQYPPFPLKLIFTAGGKPFLTGVSVAITPAAGGPPVVVAPEHVQGPWLFVDVPPGVYRVTAVHAGESQTLKQVKVTAGRQTTLHLRWTEDRGIAALPAE